MTNEEPLPKKVSVLKLKEKSTAKHLHIEMSLISLAIQMFVFAVFSSSPGEVSGRLSQGCHRVTRLAQIQRCRIGEENFRQT